MRYTERKRNKRETGSRKGGEEIKEYNDNSINLVFANNRLTGRKIEQK